MKPAQEIRTGKQIEVEKKMAGVTGLEPAASGVTGQRSNQLSYTPALACGLRQGVGQVKPHYGAIPLPREQSRLRAKQPGFDPAGADRIARY